LPELFSNPESTKEFLKSYMLSSMVSKSLDCKTVSYNVLYETMRYGLCQNEEGKDVDLFMHFLKADPDLLVHAGEETVTEYSQNSASLFSALAIDPVYYPHINYLFDKIPDTAKRIEAQDITSMNSDTNESAASVLSKTPAGIAIFKRIIVCDNDVKSFFCNMYRMLCKEEYKEMAVLPLLIHIKKIIDTLSQSPEGKEVLQLMGIKMAVLPAHDPKLFGGRQGEAQVAQQPAADVTFSGPS
jgi:hypothetical protein